MVRFSSRRPLPLKNLKNIVSASSELISNFGCVPVFTRKVGQTYVMLG